MAPPDPNTHDRVPHNPDGSLASTSFTYGPSTKLRVHELKYPAAERDADASATASKSAETPRPADTLTSPTRTTTTPDAESPELSVTVNVNGNSPRAENTRVATAPDADHPDPSDHTWDTTTPSGSQDPDPSRPTDTGPPPTLPTTGDAPATANGARGNAPTDTSRSTVTSSPAIPTARNRTV